MSASSIAKRLSHPQRDVLLAHVESDQPINLRGSVSAKRMATQALIKRGLLTGNIKCVRSRPKITTLTLLGREVAGLLLGQMADRLVISGGLDDFAGLRMTYTRLREMRLMIISATALTEPLPSPAMMAVPAKEIADDRPEPSPRDAD